MSPRIQVSNKRTSTSNHSVVEESPRIEEVDYNTSSDDEEEAPHARSRDSQGRPSYNLCFYNVAQVMRANQKTPPFAAAATTAGAATTTACLGSSTRARALQSPYIQAVRSNTSA